ncbi:uncharacterized protein LOC119488550 [Sebastes umbrosus]|uniref:uncharacterized protein LOC119488550 n=1 Tax=Sebastes umbrosus TaxID=72105 RepID=UPI00189EE3D4|nr:uncharacterized protein LOC119488550 [Sebastes umbrosus]
MDPADTDSLRQALASQGSLVGQHDKILRELVENLRALSSNVIQLGSQMDQVNAHLTASSATAASPADPPPALPTPPPGHATPAPLAREPFIPTPERYSGDLGACGRFLLQCSVVFQQQPTTYPVLHQPAPQFLSTTLNGGAHAVGTSSSLTLRAPTASQGWCVYLLWQGWPLPRFLSSPAKRLGSSGTGEALMSHTSTSPSAPHPRMQFNASLVCQGDSIPLLALVDSGADDNFIDSTLVTQAGIPVEALPAPKDVNALDGRLLARITHHTVPLSLILSARSQVLQWGHSSKLTCHPGFHRTLSFIKRRFWWPSMTRDTRAFVSACSVCARSKASHQPPAGLLRPLPVPSRPWSHIAVDFVTGLPPSEGNTIILTVVDNFSKAVHFVPLPKLPSATETADLLVLHVFRLHRSKPTSKGVGGFGERSGLPFSVQLSGINALLTAIDPLHPLTNPVKSPLCPPAEPPSTPPDYRQSPCLHCSADSGRPPPRPGVPVLG